MRFDPCAGHRAKKGNVVFETEVGLLGVSRLELQPGDNLLALLNFDLETLVVFDTDARKYSLATQQRALTVESRQFDPPVRVRAFWPC